MTSGIAVLLVGLGTAASAADTTWSFSSTSFTGAVGSVQSKPISVEGQFNYDADTDTVSNVDVTLTIDGTATNITNSGPNLQGLFLVLTNSVTDLEPVVFFQIAELVQTGSTADVAVYAGLCRVDGTSCNSSNYGFGTVSFSFVDAAAASTDSAETVTTTITADAFTRTKATILSNSRMMDMATTRFINESSLGPDNEISRDNVTGPLGLQLTGFDLDANDDGGVLLSSLSYMDVANGWRRVGFAELRFQDTQGVGSTLSVNGRISQERYMSASTLYGYFLGAELHRSDLEGTFAGNQDSWGVLAGAYTITRAQNGLIGSAYGALGFNRSNLDVGDGSSTVTDGYDSRSLMLGAKLSGDLDYTTYRLRPSLAANYAATDIGTLSMTETVSGVASDLVVPVGTVRFMDLVATSEFIFEVTPIGTGFSVTEFSVAPRLTCERRNAAIDSRKCGSGLALGLTSASHDGMTTLNGSVSFDRIGGQDRRAIQLQTAMRF